VGLLNLIKMEIVRLPSRHIHNQQIGKVKMTCESKCSKRVNHPYGDEVRVFIIRINKWPDDATETSGRDYDYGRDTICPFLEQTVPPGTFKNADRIIGTPCYEDYRDRGVIWYFNGKFLCQECYEACPIPDANHHAKLSDCISDYNITVNVSWTFEERLKAKRNRLYMAADMRIRDRLCDFFKKRPSVIKVNYNEPDPNLSDGTTFSDYVGSREFEVLSTVVTTSTEINESIDALIAHLWNDKRGFCEVDNKAVAALNNLPVTYIRFCEPTQNPSWDQQRSGGFNKYVALGLREELIGPYDSSVGGFKVTPPKLEDFDKVFLPLKWAADALDWWCVTLPCYEGPVQFLVRTCNPSLPKHIADKRRLFYDIDDAIEHIEAVTDCEEFAEEMYGSDSFHDITGIIKGEFYFAVPKFTWK
jgi:hypothetical protein